MLSYLTRALAQKVPNSMISSSEVENAHLTEPSIDTQVAHWQSALQLIIARNDTLLDLGYLDGVTLMNAQFADLHAINFLIH